MKQSTFIYLASATLILAAPTILHPSVTVPSGTVFIGSSEGKIDTWDGIRYAQPPIGPLRFAAPLPFPAGNNFGIVDATTAGLNCPQMNIVAGAFNLPPALADVVNKAVKYIEEIPFLRGIAATNAGEDCLNLKVQRPAGTAKDAGLPVMIWNFPGAFVFGGSSMYSGAKLIQRSVDMNQPIIFVVPNTRTNSFGFLPGQEVQNDHSASVNAGLQDQREAMRWVRENIASFGGDPNKVTIFGESSGAISVAFQLLANNGDNEGLFRAAIMESGSPLPVEKTSRGQPVFNEICKFAGCDQSPDKLSCLRALPYEKMVAATNSLVGVLSYTSIALNFVPRTDGVFLTDQAHTLIEQGKYSKIPIISGDQYDEGSVFAFGALNVTTTPELNDYLQHNFFPNSTQLHRDTILDLYPQDPRQGSPFDSGFLNILTPQNKRINAILGDAVFQSPRRAFLAAARKEMPVYSYASRVFKHLPLLGSFHASDVLSVIGFLPFSPTKEMQTRWIAFANNLDPNYEGYINWPKYGDDVNEGTSTLLQFSEWSTTLISDNYRAAAIAYWATIQPFLAL